MCIYEIDGVKFLDWKSGCVKFWTNSMSELRVKKEFFYNVCAFSLIQVGHIYFRTHVPGSAASASSKLVRSSPPSKPRWPLLSQLPECQNCKIRRKEGKLEKESKQTTNYLGHCSFWASQFWLVRRFKGFQLRKQSCDYSVLLCWLLVCWNVDP